MYLTYINIRSNIKSTILAISGITISIAALLIAIGISNGLSDNTLGSILSVSPHIKLNNNFGLILNYESKISLLEDVKGISAIYPKIVGKGLIKSNSIYGNISEGIIFEGYRELDLELLDFDLKITKGNLELGCNSILIGEELANLLEVTIDDKIKLLSYENIENEFTVSGIFNTGHYNYDSNFVLILFEKAQQILKMDGATEIDIKLKDIYKADFLTDEIEEKTFLNAASWTKINRQLLKGIMLEKSVVVILLSLLLVIAGFIVFVLISNIVRENRKEIGILKVIGFSNIDIALSFLYMAIIFNVLGSVLGIFLTIIFKIFLSNFSLLAINEVYYIPDYIPFVLSLKEILIVLLGSKSIIVLSSLMPVLQALKIDPVKVLKND